MTIIGTEPEAGGLESQGETYSPAEKHSLAQQDNQNSTNPLPEQGELVFAIVEGEAVTEVPKDLYIPPDALEVFLEAFEGPLDLLLYLIKKQNIDILDINVADITEQYMAYVELMEAHQFELAAEYLVMAAMLTEIKSRMLLPRQETDPRMELIRRLQEYERYKEAAENLNSLPRLDRNFYRASAALPKIDRITPNPDVDLKEILLALASVLRRVDMFGHHHIQFETLSTREKMSEILAHLSEEKFVPLVSLLTKKEGRLGVVVTFLAVMELMKDSLIEIVQTDSFGPIHVKSRG